LTKRFPFFSHHAPDWALSQTQQYMNQYLQFS
jgi:hypothetical protein